MFGKKSHGPGDGAGKKGIKAAPVDDDMDAFDLKESSPTKSGLADMGGGPSMEEILASLEQILEDDADEEFIPAPPMAAEDAEPLTSRGKSKKSAPPVTAPPAPAKPDKVAPVAEAVPASGKGAWKAAPVEAKSPALGAGDLVDEFLTEEIPLDLDGSEFADTGEGEEEDEVLDLLGSELDEAADLLDDEPMDLAGTEVLDEEEDAGEPLDLSGMMAGDAELEEGDGEDAGEPLDLSGMMAGDEEDEEPLDLVGAEVMDEEEEEPMDLAGRSLLDGLSLSDEDEEESEEMPLDLASLSGGEEEEEEESEESGLPLDLSALSGDEDEEESEESGLPLDLSALSGDEDEEESEESGLPLDLSALSGDEDEEEAEESGIPLDLVEGDADGEVEVDLSVLLATSAEEPTGGDLDMMDGLVDEEMVSEMMPQLAFGLSGDGEDGEGLDDEATLGEDSESLEEAMEEMDALADMEGDLPVEEEEEEEPAPVFQGLSVGIATLQEEPPPRKARREGFTDAEVEATARQLIAEVLAELLPGLVEEEARREMERLKQD